MKEKIKINNKLINIVVIITIIFLIYILKDMWISIITFLKRILLPFIISFFLAYFFYPLVKFFNKKGLNNILSCLIIILTIIITFGTIIYFSIPIISKQVINFSKLTSNYINNNLNNNIPVINDALISIESFLYNHIITFLAKSINLISDLFIISILFILFLLNMKKIRYKLYRLFAKNKYYSLIFNIDNDLNKYFKSVSIIFIIEFIEYTFLYFIIGHPNFLLLGILSGIATLIPYFGSIFTNFFALITALAISKKLFILTAFIAILTPIFDSYIVDPKIYHKYIKINPLISIISIILSSSIFGFIGIIIAIPLYIVISNIIKFVSKNKTISF